MFDKLHDDDFSFDTEEGLIRLQVEEDKTGMLSSHVLARSRDGEFRQ